MITFKRIPSGIAFGWMDHTDDGSTLVQTMALCRQAMLTQIYVAIHGHYVTVD